MPSTCDMQPQQQHRGNSGKIAPVSALRLENKHTIRTQTNIKFHAFFKSNFWLQFGLANNSAPVSCPAFSGQNNYKNESNQSENHLAPSLPKSVFPAPVVCTQVRIQIRIQIMSAGHRSSLQSGKGRGLNFQETQGVEAIFYTMPYQRPFFLILCIFSWEFMAFIWGAKGISFPRPQITNWLKTCLGWQIILFVCLLVWCRKQFHFKRINILFI